MSDDCTLVIGLLAETMVHVGTGRSLGVVDLPVAREPATDYPYIPGSSLKGALRDLYRQLKNGDGKELFGDQDRAGKVRISDAQIVLLPVRSLEGAYKWVTCPLVLERLGRMMARAKLECVPDKPVNVPLWIPKDRREGQEEAIFLEEREFYLSQSDPEPLSPWSELLKKLIAHEATRSRLESQLVVVSDDDFAWFARYALAITARNVLDEETKTSKNLWYEEALPPDTLMCALVHCMDKQAAKEIAGLLKEGNGKGFLQVGGNETTGQGWMSIKVVEKGDGGH